MTHFSLWVCSLCTRSARFRSNGRNSQDIGAARCPERHPCGDDQPVAGFGELLALCDPAGPDHHVEETGRVFSLHAMHTPGQRQAPRGLDDRRQHQDRHLGPFARGAQPGGARRRVANDGRRLEGFGHLARRQRDRVRRCRLRVGVLGIGSCSDWITRKVVSHHGLDPDSDIEIVPLLGDYPRVVDLVADGALDACMITEPSVAVGEERGVLDFWAAGYEDPYLPDYQWIVRVARDELIERDPDLIRAVLRGCRKSAHYAAAHVDEWIALAARQFGISEQAARRAVERELPRLELDCGLDMAGLQTATDLQYTLGGIKSPARAEDLVDLRFLPNGKIAA